MRLLGKIITFFSSEDNPPTLQTLSTTFKSDSTIHEQPERLNTTTAPHDAGMHREAQAEVQALLAQYQYVLVPCTKPLADFSPWCKPPTSGSRSQSHRPNFYTWLTPFLLPSVHKHPSLDLVLQRGVANAKAIPSVLRSLIKEKRKAKEPYGELLQALYGACVLVDFSESLRVESQVFFHDIAHFVDFSDLLTMRCDFTRMGYRRVQTLKSTDIKWLVSEFGEPSVHLSYVPLWESLRRDAVRRYCRAEIARNDSRGKTAKDVEDTLPEWLRGRVEFCMRLRADDQARAAATLARNQQRTAALSSFADVWNSTEQEFVVADLETTGLDPRSCEILEFAAVLSDSRGTIVYEFSALVRVMAPIPALITNLTGISQREVEREGRPLQEVLHAFIAFLGNRPVFFHNAPFDTAFLQQATQKSSLPFSNLVHDTLPVARAAWPEMRSHKLETLAKIIDAAPTPTHRALADAKTALAVLLAAREIAGR
jgi:DNA polymerase-3 subunit epsilon